MIPAASSSASVDWRCDVDGGWTTIVWTLPSEAVSSGSVERVDDRPSGGAATGDLEREHPAGDAGAELAAGDLVLRVAGQARVEHRRHAVLTLEPAGQCRGRRGVALDPDGEGQDPAQDEEGVERPEGAPRCRSGRARPRRSGRPGRPPRRR